MCRHIMLARKGSRGIQFPIVFQSKYPPASKPPWNQTHSLTNHQGINTNSSADYQEVHNHFSADHQEVNTVSCIRSPATNNTLGQQISA